jgi:biopolymer transport protein ExbD
MNRTITISLLVGVLIFVMWFGVSFFLIPKLTEVKVMPDPSISPPVVTDGDNPNRSKGRIVVNIRNDGSVTGQDLNVLETDEAIAEYISKCRDEFESEGLVPKLQLRGDEKSVFEHSRKVIKIANEQNVTQVVFAVYENATSLASGDKGEEAIDQNKNATPPKTGLIDSIADLIAIKPRDQDLNMALPTPIKPEENGDPVFIVLTSKGHVLFGKDKQLLDQDTSVRDLPLLNAELDKAKQKAGDKKLLVSIHVESDTAQHRVIDVLNALAACGITSVTFTDLIE